MCACVSVLHAHAGIGDGEHHVFSGREDLRRAREGAVELHVGGFDGQAAAAGHGVASVDGEIHDDLLDLAAVGLDEPEILYRAGVELDIFADEAAQHFLHFADDGLNIENFRRENLLAAEGQQLLRERGGALRGDLDLLGVAAQRIFHGKTLGQAGRHSPE